MSRILNRIYIYFSLIASLFLFRSVSAQAIIKFYQEYPLTNEPLLHSPAFESTTNKAGLSGLALLGKITLNGQKFYILGSPSNTKGSYTGPVYLNSTLLPDTTNARLKILIDTFSFAPVRIKFQREYSLEVHQNGMLLRKLSYDNLFVVKNSIPFQIKWVKETYDKTTKQFLRSEVSKEITVFAGTPTYIGSEIKEKKDKLILSDLTIEKDSVFYLNLLNERRKSKTCIVAEGSIKNCEWNGKCVDGLANGKGKLKYQDFYGNEYIYVGEMKNGMIHGIGRRGFYKTYGAYGNHFDTLYYREVKIATSSMTVKGIVKNDYNHYFTYWGGLIIKPKPSEYNCLECTFSDGKNKLQIDTAYFYSHMETDSLNPGFTKEKEAERNNTKWLDTQAEHIFITDGGVKISDFLGKPKHSTPLLVIQCKNRKVMGIKPHGSLKEITKWQTMGDGRIFDDLVEAINHSCCCIN